MKPDQAAGPDAPARPGGTGDSTADPADSDAAGWSVSAAIGAGMGQQPSESASDSELDGTLLARWVEARRFSTTRLRPGYDELEVDAFLDEAELRLAAQAGAGARAARRSGAAGSAAGAAQISCLECGAAGAEATEVCARCGAPAGYQPSAADPAVAQGGGRGGPSPRLLITAGVATLVLGGGLLAGLAYSGAWTSSFPSTDWLTVYQLQTGECLQTWGETLGSFNDGNGPFTAVPCDQPHTAEVFFAGDAWPRSLAYPGDQVLYDDGYVRCDTAFAAYDGIGSSSSAFTVVPSTPDGSTWPGGDRWLVCLATEYGSVDYSIRGSRQ